MAHDSFSNSQIDDLKTFSESTACSPDDKIIATQLINVRMPRSCSSSGSKNDGIAEVSINFCMPSKCAEDPTEQFARRLEGIVKVGEQDYILKPDGASSGLKLGECINKLKVLVPNKDIAFLGGKIIATCKEDSRCEKCVEAVNNAMKENIEQYASVWPEIMYGDFGSNTYDNTII